MIDSHRFKFEIQVEKDIMKTNYIKYLVIKNNKKGYHGIKDMFQGKTDAAYTAVGLSFDNKMGDDSVMVCMHNNNNVSVQMYWNLPNYAGQIF